MQQESEGNQTHFGAIVGVDRKTVGRWLAATVDVSEEKVRAVARALGIPAASLLVQVGYYSRDEMPPLEELPPLANPNAAIEMVRDSDLPPSEKRKLIAHITAQDEAHRRQQMEETGRLIDMARRRRRAS